MKSAPYTSRTSRKTIILLSEKIANSSNPPGNVRRYTGPPPPKDQLNQCIHATLATSGIEAIIPRSWWVGGVYLAPLHNLLLKYSKRFVRIV